NLNGPATLINCTVSGNSAGDGGGIRSYISLTIGNSIDAGNTGDLSGPGSLTSLGNNLIGGDPMLAPLADNGGPTQTMALVPARPATAPGSNAPPPPGVTTDQRYFARIVGDIVDIGAYEANAEPPRLVVTTADDVVDATDDKTSLREAIDYANLHPGDD